MAEPTDAGWLDAAIELAEVGAGHPFPMNAGRKVTARAINELIAERIRIAAPHIRRAVLEEAAAADWTVNTETNFSNSSAEFERLRAEVTGIIRESAHALIAGRADMVAGLVMAQLAHKQGLVPLSWLRGRVDGNG